MTILDLSGIAGARFTVHRESNGAQPYAQMYTAPAGDIRLRVWPVKGTQRVGASASCVALR